MANLVFINGIGQGTGYAVPVPTTYDSNTATIVDSARNANGQMIGSVIREGVSKVSMTWAYLSAADWANLIKQFSSTHGGAFIRSVTFFNQETNSLSTKNMYVGDRNAGVLMLYDADTAPSSDLIGLPMGYKDAKFSLIEV